MAIRLPEAGEGHLWSESVTPDPLTEVAPETRAGLEAMQALDDDLFVSTSLAELATSHRNEAERRHRGAEVLEPDARLRAADGFAGGLDRAFQRDVEDRVAALRTLQGPSPSDGAQGRLREQAGRLRQDLLVKAVTAEDRIRKQGQLGRAERAAAALAPLVREQPDALDEALRRLDDLGRSIRPLTGDEAADAFLSSGRARLAESALGGFNDLAPDLALSALESGAFDGQLDPARKRRYLKAARDGIAARRTDERILEEHLAADQVRRRQAQALSFAAGFTDRLAAGETALNEDLARAEAEGVVPPAQAARLRRRMADAEIARAERDARTARVAALLEEGGALDPESDADRQDASLWFDAYIKPGLDALLPAGRLGVIRRLEESIGFVPEAAICPLAGAMLTGPAQDRLAAAQTLIEIVGRQREAASRLPPGAVPMARLFGDLDRFGIDAEIAASWIDDPGSVRNPVVRDVLFRAGRDDAGFVAAYQFNSKPSRLKLLSADAADTWPDSEGNGGAGGTEMERRLSKSIEAGSDHDRFDPQGENDEPSRGRESDGAATGDEVSIGAAAGTASRGIVSGILPQTEAEMHAARKNFEERLVGSQMPAGEHFVTTGALRRGGPKISNALDRNNLKETRRTLEKWLG